MKYHELHYRINEFSSSVAAGRAVHILEAAERIDPGFLAYLLQPSNLLLLAGLRAESPYLAFPPRMTRVRRSRLTALLGQHEILIVPERTSYEHDLPESFALVSPAHLGDITKRYTALCDEWIVPVDYSARGYAEWCYVMENRLAKMMSDERLPNEWLRDWWAPHHLRFGAILGYPGVAISSALWAEAIMVRTGREQSLTEILITPESDTGYGTRVCYDVAVQAREVAEVNQVRDLWTATIAEVNVSFPSDRVSDSPAWLAELDAIALARASNII